MQNQPEDRLDKRGRRLVEIALLTNPEIEREIRRDGLEAWKQIELTTRTYLNLAIARDIKFGRNGSSDSDRPG